MKNWFLTNVGIYYFKYFDKGKQYLMDVCQLSDTIMIDGNINTVMVDDEDKINTLIDYLDKEEKQGLLTYGVHITYASVMSCYVQDMQSKYIHFVDATEGGYTSAAKMLKQKISK